MSQSNIDNSSSFVREAFEQVKPELDAISEESFVSVTADIMAATTTAQGVHREVLALRPDIVQHLPSFKIAYLDNLKTYARALMCAQADYKAATDPRITLTHLADDAISTRAILLADVNSLIAYGLLEASVVNDLKGVIGYKNVMMDIMNLAAILRKNAAKIAERTRVTPSELSAAENMAAQFSEAVGLREQSPQQIAEATRNRQAAYTLFMKAYEEVRSAVQYLRRDHGDADTIIPSLFANRGNRRRSTDQPTDKPNTPTPAPSPVVNPPTPAGNNGSQTKSSISEHGPYV